MNYHIELTEQHLLRGERKNPFGCAVCLAINENFPDKRIMVDGKYVSLYDDRYREVRFELPEEIQKWINSYDNGHEVEPVIFEVEI